MYHVAVSVRLCHCQTLNLWRVVLAYGFEAHAFSQMYVGGCVGPLRRLSASAYLGSRTKRCLSDCLPCPYCPRYGTLLRGAALSDQVWEVSVATHDAAAMGVAKPSGRAMHSTRSDVWSVSATTYHVLEGMCWAANEEWTTSRDHVRRVCWVAWRAGSAAANVLCVLCVAVDAAVHGCVV